MKKFLQYSGIISAVLALVGFILLIACHGIVGVDDPAGNWYSAGAVLFGNGPAKVTAFWVFTGTFEGQPSGAALVAWIFSLVALLALICGVVLPLLKVKLSAKVAGLVNLCAVILLITAGIVLFFTVPSWMGNNGYDGNGWGLSAGYVIAGILYIVGGAVAICPAVVDFVSKKR